MEEVATTRATLLLDKILRAKAYRQGHLGHEPKFLVIHPEDWHTILLESGSASTAFLGWSEFKRKAIFGLVVYQSPDIEVGTVEVG